MESITVTQPQHGDKRGHNSAGENDVQMEEHRLERDGDLDLQFTGTLIGEGRHGWGGNSGYANDWTRGVNVDIYVTQGRKLVTSVKRWSRWQGEHDTYNVEVHQSPEDCLNWLMGDCGKLGVASKEAWEEACQNVAWLEGKDVEVIA